MSSREATLCDLYDAVDAGDWPRMLEHLADDVAWQVEHNDLVRDCAVTGRAQVQRWCQEVLAPVQRAHRPRRFVHDGAVSVAFVDVTLRLDGHETNASVVDVFRFEGGRIAERVRVQAG